MRRGNRISIIRYVQCGLRESIRSVKKAYSGCVLQETISHFANGLTSAMRHDHRERIDDIWNQCERVRV